MPRLRRFSGGNLLGLFPGELPPSLDDHVAVQRIATCYKVRNCITSR
jgi:hypothetical protein